MRIALVGNPNSGKTTMFNVLTGRNEKVGNWSGVTVDKKEYPVKKSYYLTYHVKDPLIATDLPGAYSMSPFTSEESITREYIKSESPDVIVNVVDSVNLGRSLFFTTQLLELGIPVVIVLNKNDASLKKGILIDAGLLSKRLGCPVIKITARNATGFDEVINAVFCVEGRRQKAPYIERGVNPADKKAVDMADRRRYLFVDGIVKAVEKRQAVSNKKNVHDKIDAILINRWLGIPVFALVMS